MTHFTAPDGAQIAFVDQGSGPPVLALCGLTRNMADFDDFAALGLPVRLIRMDYRGRGASDFTGAATYTIATEAEDAIALLDHLGVDQACILGTSRGGLIAMLLATTHKPRLAGVILNDIGPVLGATGFAHIATHVGIPPKAATYDEAARLLQSANAAENPGVPLARWRIAAQRRFVETPEGLALRYDPELRTASIPPQGTEIPTAWPLFDALEGIPLGLIRGANSKLLEPKTAQEMRARRPDMAYAEVPDRGHVPFLDEPEAVAVIKEVLALP